jgi:hypothetical protein
MRFTLVLLILAATVPAQESNCISLQSATLTTDSIRVSLTNTCAKGVYIRINVFNSKNDTVARGKGCDCEQLLPLNTVIQKTFRLVPNYELTDTLYVRFLHAGDSLGGADVRTTFLKSSLQPVAIRRQNSPARNGQAVGSPARDAFVYKKSLRRPNGRAEKAPASR